ncbi:GspE/PulE family protein [Roseiconus lacunae]|uniref:ATPase, T2SS/T4P/T4SS family n=1 Tax=Roseiconus lacunae TaxID=2605694 RepID=A0ABT7PGY9_9BACT|nr:ATPase, T2SS/T4P/T4SS family [Roseiconus lacunae]MDM4015764.1 ATPase, T2SS/T4P/T4SS family [Roseiconus lacunae]
MNVSIDDIAAKLRMPVAEDLSQFEASSDFLNRISIGHARQHNVIGLRGKGEDELWLAIDSVSGLNQVDVIGRALSQNPGGGLRRIALRPLPATSEAIQKAINRAYTEQSSQTQRVIDSLDRETLLGELARLGPREDLLDTEGRAPVIRLVNHLLFDAVKSGASDVHIQPYEDRLMVRQRIDGVLFDTFEIPKTVQEEVLSRVKVLGKMNIAEKRLPQDGRATVQLGERIVDLRIASLPTSHNERIVIRLLDKGARLYSLAELGMPTDKLAMFKELIGRDHGLILVTGPTGSGKSTTLYGALQELDSEELNILTLEDPIEYQLEGISQTQINEKKGMTFASGMRSVLRQDPDIIMVGEIRDSETAMMAIQASLTGHLVFSTLHTNDAASAVTRLLDLGIEPYLVSSSLVASLAQRLVRQLCPHCKTTCANLNDDLHASQPVGCEACRQTGYAGRIGLFELLVIDEACRELIGRRASAAEIREAGLKSGLQLLANDGLEKVRQGITTLDEVRRVTTL